MLLAFPLHPAGQPATDRAAHLQKISVPLLFIQGSHDALADLSLLRPVLERLGARTRLHVLQDADHSFHVPARSARKESDVREEAFDAVCAWLGRLGVKIP